MTNQKSDVLYLSAENQSVVPELAISLDEARERIEKLHRFINECMCQGLDYGIVPGCDKPTLLKPGAEKLCDVFGFSKHIEVLCRTEDYSKGFFSYEVKAILINKRTCNVEAEGVGCCNSRETRFAEQNPYNIANTLIKMAKKRAIVDAVLSATRSSGIFTQDMEDILPVKPTPAPAENRTQSGRKPAVRAITQKQKSYISKLMEQKNIPIEQVREILLNKFSSDNLSRLTSHQASDLIKHLQG